MKMLSRLMHRPECWIIAYDNSPRVNHGIAPLVARHLAEAIGPTEKIATCIVHHLDLPMLERIQGCRHLIFVDCCFRTLENGVRWTLIEPELNGWAAGAYDLSPGMFVGLLKLLYDCTPEVWMVAVQGHCLGTNVNPGPKIRHAAETATRQIVDWLFLNGITLSERLPEKVLGNSEPETAV